ncbi:hypothetical protein BST40_15175, partial [Mycobacterium persicum]
VGVAAGAPMLVGVMPMGEDGDSAAFAAALAEVGAAYVSTAAEHAAARGVFSDAQSVSAGMTVASEALPSSPSIADRATEIGREVSTLPRGTRLDTLADRITGLHVSQEEAVEATDIAAKAAFGETGGIVNVPDGTKVVLPADLAYGEQWWYILTDR